MITRFRILAAILIALTTASASARAEVYHCYFGGTHSHTTYSDGKDATPADAFGKAKACGYDFYSVTNHALAKYKRFTPESYGITKRTADEFTDDTFVAICGFEFSENDGPDGTGHLTALNTVGYLDATGPKVNLPTFYDWLVTNQPTTVAASFNHARKDTFNSFGYLTPARRDGVTMYEMINSGKLHYDGFLAALNKGWRVAPNAGIDAHGLWPIDHNTYRTGILAEKLTRDGIMQAIRARRVYCTWDSNLHLSFSANGHIMGSVLDSPTTLSFRVDAYDPDASGANDRIMRIEIVGENGKPVASKDFSSHSVSWRTECAPTQKYYFVQVYCADKTDGPTAYSAPIWIERD